MSSSLQRRNAPFRLKPVRAARVSELSEATAASSAAPEDRVNFHIGNPVQDDRLAAYMLRSMLGLDPRTGPAGASLSTIVEEMELEEEEKPVVEFLQKLVRASAPYAPRGGFQRKSPHPLVQTFAQWLQNQPDPLSYDVGEQTGVREVILASGGKDEVLRVFLHALSSYLLNLPARIVFASLRVPEVAAHSSGLEIVSLKEESGKWLPALREILNASGEAPVFLFLGEIPDEESRRQLRQLTLDHPLMIVEVNDAPNRQSLAREAGLTGRVVRLLTPGIFGAALQQLATMFVAGPADILSVIETMHFQLKGTPSASEIELLNFLLQRKRKPDGQTAELPQPAFEGFWTPATQHRSLTALAAHVEQRFAAIVNRQAEVLGREVDDASEFAEHVLRKAAGKVPVQAGDAFAADPPVSVCERLSSRLWAAQDAGHLVGAFLGAFLRHHPEYRPNDCAVVSGSSRTGLGILGFHCGISEVVIPDLSWSYEHCFPSVRSVPLRPGFRLDAQAVLAVVDALLASDPAWKKRGAVVINNPHNATGRVFAEADVRLLLQGLLERGVRVIDDLSYQDVAPVASLPHIPTLRQLTDDLVRTGHVPAESSDRVITIHSMSKTDCLAGARLSVAEIRDPEVMTKFRAVNDRIAPNLGAILLTYLFYRRDRSTVQGFWRLRNSIFEERSKALVGAVGQLPDERNPFGIGILPPDGSMYPIMTIDRLPGGLSLDWLASGLARQGIGLLPLSTFARTEDGFESGRKAFRLTLGGTDGAEVLLMKTRRVLIDLNRLIGEEAASYNRKTPVYRSATESASDHVRRLLERWNPLEESIRETGERLLSHASAKFTGGIGDADKRRFAGEYLPHRLEMFRQRLRDRGALAFETMQIARGDSGAFLENTLEREFYKDSLDRRQEEFRRRLFDRTVHPTQMYSIRAEAVLNDAVNAIVRETSLPETWTANAARELLEEFLGRNVAINSVEEGQELLLDLETHVSTEIAGAVHSDHLSRTFLSFWGDWDGSNRPSGQGHRLVAAAVVENVSQLSRLIHLLRQAEPGLRIEPDLLENIEGLGQANRRFGALLNEITHLTHQLEKRYRGLLPVHVHPGVLGRIGMALHVAGDPLTRLWRHNDRLERRMLDLRHQRREALQRYFALNKRLRKQLHALIPALRDHRSDDRLLREACLYRDLLQRMAITPRIHQKMITAQDPFAIETTVFNIHEINEIAGASGNPAMVLGLQVSMASRAEALIALDRMMKMRREEVRRRSPEAEIPSVWLIPLFEDMDSVQSIPGYLDKVWEYAHQGRRVDEETRDRCAEMLCEVFIAGSDLSQQVGQAAGAALYRQAKHEILLWLADHGLVERVRVKMGSGEPMQRQGGYFAEHSGERAFVPSADAMKRWAGSLPAAARTSARYATTPLMGVFTGGDLRTFQSTLSEQLRTLPVEQVTQMFAHVRESQRMHRNDLVRAAETLTDSRLQKKTRGAQELERLTVGTKETLGAEFLKTATENFRAILYGRETDLVGIHIISYFIARTMPQLRDRPTVRPGSERPSDRGQQILERIAQTVPLARYGSMLRAIAHNQSQTMVLGVNQLTTGVFRALEIMSRRQYAEGDAVTLLADRVLPTLPVYEILQSLRLYHDPALTYARRLESAFPAGTFAFLALREDNDAIGRFVGILQQELLRRHGLDVEEFFDGDEFRQNLLPTLRPDLAVLFQRDLFNGDFDRMLAPVRGPVPATWSAEVRRLLETPGRIMALREEMWNLLERPVYERVQSFVELAGALNTLASAKAATSLPGSPRPVRIPTALTNFFRMSSADDEMRQFLAAAVEYLDAAAEGMIEVPVTIVRAMNDVERLARIEEQALTPARQERLRYYVLQMARLTGENG